VLHGLVAVNLADLSIILLPLSISPHPDSSADSLRVTTVGARVAPTDPRWRVTWTYGPDAGPGALDRPSLAVPISRDLIVATDDYGQRVVVIDKRTKRIVWQYGHLDQPRSAPGYLNKPDGLDLIR
jgi:hypothetical protein